jgi:hypothetical protein
MEGLDEASALLIKFNGRWAEDPAVADLLRESGWTAEDQARVEKEWSLWGDQPAWSREIAEVVHSRQAAKGSLQSRKRAFGLGTTNVLVGLHAEAVLISEDPEAFPKDWRISGEARTRADGVALPEIQRCSGSLLSAGGNIWARILRAGWPVFRTGLLTAGDLKDRWRNITGKRVVEHLPAGGGAAGKRSRDNGSSDGGFAEAIGRGIRGHRPGPDRMHGSASASASVSEPSILSDY